MEMSYTLLVTLFLALVIVTCDCANSEVSGTSKDRVDTETSKQYNTKDEQVVKPANKGKSVDAKKLETSNQKTNGNENVVKPENKGKDQADGLLNKKVRKGIVDLDKNESGKQLGLEEAGKKQKKRNDSESDKVDKKEKSREGLDSESKKEILPAVRKEGLRGEECDSSSNGCTIEENAMVSCLRVPGNESADLSLLIQNKGKGTISVTISAPAFVKLEKKQIQLQEKENKKVRVSIGKGGTDNTINLKVGNGKCTIDFKDLITQGSLKQSVSSSQFAYINFFKGTPSIWFTFLGGALLVIASVGIFISFRLKHSLKGGFRYEKLDMELPVSSVSTKALESNDGWDNSWDESWDNEEAPQMPSMPVTPSVSSKGIAARRLNKEGWKD